MSEKERIPWGRRTGDVVFSRLHRKLPQAWGMMDSWNLMCRAPGCGAWLGCIEVKMPTELNKAMTWTRHVAFAGGVEAYRLIVQETEELTAISPEWTAYVEWEGALRERHEVTIHGRAPLRGGDGITVRATSSATDR